MVQCFNQVRIINVHGLKNAFELRGLCLWESDVGCLHIVAESKLAGSQGEEFSSPEEAVECKHKHNADIEVSPTIEPVCNGKGCHFGEWWCSSRNLFLSPQLV